MEFNEINEIISLKYKGQDSLAYKLDYLNKIRKLFYEYALKQVKEDYRTFGYIDGPYFDYLVEKKDNSIKNLIINISKNKNISNDQRNEIMPKLLNWYVTYYTQDLDGYTNLRKEKSTKSEILQQIKNGEQVEVLNNEDNWWLIKTKAGKQGYVYYDRVKIME